MTTRLTKLTQGQYLAPSGPYVLASTDNQYVAEVTTSGVFRIRNVYTGLVSWSTGTDGDPLHNIVSVTLTNGSLVGVNLYGTVIFFTACFTTRADSYFQVETNGSGNVYNFLYSSEWNTNTGLYMFQRLYLGKSLGGGLKFDTSGILTLTTGRTTVWKSANKPNVATASSYVTVLPSGEVVMYSAEGGDVLWSTSTGGAGFAWFKVWATSTSSGLVNYVTVFAANAGRQSNASGLLWRNGLPKQHVASSELLLNEEALGASKTLISPSSLYTAFVWYSNAAARYELVVTDLYDEAVIGPIVRVHSMVQLSLQAGFPTGLANFLNTEAFQVAPVLQQLLPAVASHLDNKLRLTDSGVLQLENKAGCPLWSLNASLFPNKASLVNNGTPLSSPDGATKLSLAVSGLSVVLSLTTNGATTWTATYPVANANLIYNAYLVVSDAAFALQVWCEYRSVNTGSRSTVMLWTSPSASSRLVMLCVTNSGNAKLIDYNAHTLVWRALANDPVPNHAPLSLSFPAGSRPTQRYNAGKSSTSGFPNAKYLYFNIGTFVAYKPYVYVTVANGSASVSGGGGNDWTEADYVLIGFNNVTADAADPTAAQYTSPKDPQQTINVGADVHAAAAKGTINGRGSCTVAGWTAQRIAVTAGNQYALAFRLYSQSDDDTTLAWGAASIQLGDS